MRTIRAIIIHPGERGEEVQLKRDNWVNHAAQLMGGAYVELVDKIGGKDLAILADEDGLARALHLLPTQGEQQPMRADELTSGAVINVGKCSGNCCTLGATVLYITPAPGPQRIPMVLIFTKEFDLPFAVDADKEMELRN